jgi:hypothetical protein
MPTPAVELSSARHLVERTAAVPEALFRGTPLLDI